MQHRMTLTFTSTGEMEISPVSKNAIFLFFRMKNLLQAHSANSTFNKNMNPPLRKELAKIKLREIKKVSKAHLQLEIRKAANEPFTKTVSD